MNKMYRINGNTNVRVNDEIEGALRDSEYVRSHLHLVVRRRNEEMSQVLKREFLNVDLELRIRLDMICEYDQCSADAKVTKNLLDLTGISETEAWEIAEENTISETIVSTMESLFDLGTDEDPMFWIATSRTGIDGAAVLAANPVFQSFCEEQNVEACAILPSSRHELLLVPERQENAWSYKELADLVASVNCSGIVSSDITLDSVVYRYDMNTDSINIAASAM